MELLHLPSEIISEIIGYLSGKDVLELSSVNHCLNSLCNCPRIWCDVLKKFKLSQPTFYDFSIEFLQSNYWELMKSIYVNILCRWDWLFGFWNRCTPIFGGLLFVKLEIESFCRIVGYDVHGKDEQKYLVPMFIINFDPHASDRLGGNIKCAFYSTTEHTITINFDVKNPHELRISCSENFSFQDHDHNSMKTDFAETVGRNNESIVNALFEGFQNGGITFQKLSIPSVTGGKELIEPGFFAGDYGVHGTEILLLKHISDSILLEKVTGDRHVRSGAVSVALDLTCPIDYTGVLHFMLTRPDEFNVKNINESFKIEENSWLQNQIKYQRCCSVDESLLQILRVHHPDRSFGIDDSTNSYIAAFKGKITLGMMPDAVVPDYFYHELLVVVTNNDSICIYFPHAESFLGLAMVSEQIYKRLHF